TASATPGATVDAAWGAVESAFPADSPPTAPAPAPAPAPVAESAPAPAAPAPEPEADVAPRESTEDAAPILRLGAAVVGGSRHFSYVDRISPTLRPYDLFVAPLVAVRADLEPFARGGQAGLEGLGLTGEYARAFGLSSSDAAGTPVDTTWQSYRVDLRDRFRLGSAVRAGAHAGF